MNIFKLFFDHDLRLDEPAGRNTEKNDGKEESILADFMAPTLTYSKFYLTGTCLAEEKFGLDVLDKYERIILRLDEAFGQPSFACRQGDFNSLAQALPAIEVGEVIVAGEAPVEKKLLERLRVDNESNVGQRHEPLKEVLKGGNYVIYKEKAHHGFDLHLFSMENIYPSLFHAFQPLTGDDFRFFSINSKRMRSERHFYFETWTLDRPPHGAEEVLPETEL